MFMLSVFLRGSLTQYGLVGHWNRNLKELRKLCPENQLFIVIWFVLAAGVLTMDKNLETYSETLVFSG